MADPGEAGLRAALAVAAPELARLPLRINDRHPQSNPLFHSASAWIDERFVVKYAWSEIRAERLRRERILLGRLGGASVGLPVPEVVAASDEPSLFVTKVVEGGPLEWDATAGLRSDDLAAVAGELGGFLARLHAVPADEVTRGLPRLIPTAQANSDRLRRRFPALVDERQASLVLRWCDWVDQVFARPATFDPVLVHGDFHAFNQVWDQSTWALRAVVDFEESGAADPHFDFRYLPGPWRSVDLVVAVADAYREASGWQLEMERIMAWHVLTLLGDALWRTEAGVALPDGRRAAEWVDDLDGRFVALGLG